MRVYVGMDVHRKRSQGAGLEEGGRQLLIGNDHLDWAGGSRPRPGWT